MIVYKIPFLRNFSIIMPALVAYEFCLLRSLQYFSLYWWFINSSFWEILQCFYLYQCFMNSTSWEILQYFCSSRAYGLWIPHIENFAIFQPVLMVYKFHPLRNVAILLPVLMVYKLHLLIILQYICLYWNCYTPICSLRSHLW